MAIVSLSVVGTITGTPVFSVRASTEPESVNRFVSSVSTGSNSYDITFNEIKDNQNHVYLIKVVSDTCTQEASFEFLSPCSGAPGITLSTDCNSYNPTTNRVFIKVTATSAGATTVKLVITAGNETYSDGFISVGSENQISVPANTNLNVRVENSTYGSCSFSRSYTAQCAVPCSYGFNISNIACVTSNGVQEGSLDLNITDSDPGSYTYAIYDAQGTNVFKTIVFGNVRFSYGTSNTYTFTLTKAGCPPVSQTFTVNCQTGGCSRGNTSTYTLRRDSGSGYTSFTDLCNKYCNNQFTGFTGYFTGLAVNSTVYSLSTGCSTVADGYYAVLNSSNDTFILIRIQNGKITETQPPCNCSNPSLSVNVTTQQPICSNGALVGATVYLTNGVNAGKYRLCEGTSFTCSNVCADAPTLSNGSAVININAPEQGLSKNYVIRIYNTNFGCDVYRDYPITITSPICCVTREVNTNGNSTTTVNYVDCSGAAKVDTISGANVKKKYCIKEGSLTASGVATHTVTAYTCDTSSACGLSYSRTGFFCEDNLPKVRYLASGGISDTDYQIRIGNQDWINFNQDRVHVLAGQDNATYNIQIRLKSDNTCFKGETLTFTTNCTNTGTGCNKPALSTQYLGTPTSGSSYNSAVQACEEACNDRVIYGNYYSVNLNVGSTVYKTGNNTPNDCSVVVDGWYVGSTNLYRIQGGIIVEIGAKCFCGEVPTLSPSIVSGVQNGQTYTVNVGYNCTTSGIRVFKNGVLFTYLTAGTHSFTFTGDQVNNGDVFTAKTVCGSQESGSSNTTTIQKGGGDPPPQNEVCNIGSLSSGGGYEKTTRTFNITFNGTVFYMLSTGGIPDKLTVKKNGVTIYSYIPTSWRTAGSIGVSSGDTLVFEIDGTVTGVSGTGWTFYVNCTTPYNPDGNYGNDQDRNNERPTVQSIEAQCVGTQRRFVVNANTATATGSPIVQYKLLNNTRFEADSQFEEATGWQSSNVLTATITGKAIQAGKSYSVYVRDQAGKFFGISEVVNNATCGGGTPSCDKTALTTVNAVWKSNSTAFGSVDDARSSYCSGNTTNITLYSKGAITTVGNRVYATNITGDCNSVPNGFYVIADANLNPSKTIWIVDGGVYQVNDFTPCNSSTCDKSNLVMVQGRRDQNGNPFVSCADTNTKFCAAQTSDITFYLTGTVNGLGVQGSRVYANSNLSDCNSIVNGYYLHPSFSNAANSRIYGVTNGVISEVCNFSGC